MFDWNARRCTRCVCALAFTLFFAAPHLSCGQVSPADLSEASLEQLSNIKVFGASRHLQDTSDAPSSVTVITGDEIRKYGYRTLADALNSVRGFYVSSDDVYRYLGVRGFSRLGDYNTRILLLVDGHRLNDSIFDQGMIGTEFPVDIDLVQRIEVIRGPTSSLYGSNAFFGVVNIVTRRSGDLNGLELSFQPRSFGTYAGRASYGDMIHGIDTMLSATFFDSVGAKLFFPESSNATTGPRLTQATYDRYHTLFLNSSYHGFSLQAVDGYRVKGMPTSAFGTVFSDGRNSFTDQHQYIDFSYKGLRCRDLDLSLRTYYDRYGFDGIYVFPGNSLNFDYDRGQTWGAELQASRTWNQRHSIVAGTEVRSNFQQEQKNYDIAPPLIYLNTNQRSWLWAGYVQYEYALNSHVTLNAGLRRDEYSIYGGSTTPRAALILKPARKTALKVLYGTAFRTPNVYEAFYGSGEGNLTGYEIVPGLQPETMRSFEGVIEQKISDAVQLTGSVYHNDIRRLISVQKDPVSGLLFFDNLDAARSNGFEFEAQTRVRRLRAKASYAFSNADDAHNGAVLPNSPESLAKLRFLGDLYRERYFSAVEVQYTGPRNDRQGSPLPGFPLVNMTLSGNGIGRNFDLSFSVYNLLNRIYYDPTSAELSQHRLRQEGRNFRMKVTWHFGRGH